MRNLISSIHYGVRRHWWVGLRAALSFLGAAWLALEVADYLFTGLEAWFEARPIETIEIALCGALLSFLFSTYEPRRAALLVPTTNTTLQIKFGDMFNEQADYIIAVNEFFDGELGQIVASNSVHGQFISRYYRSSAASFRADIDPLLSFYQGEQAARMIQPDMKYPIGTTIRVPAGTHCAYLVALSKTDLTTHRAYADVSQLWLALTNALEVIHHLNNGADLALPLIGNGRSSLNLQPQHLLRIIVLAIVVTARKMQLPERVTIVLPEECFDKIDLREFKKNWS